jgi:DNA-binding response OmpR family regulator
VLTKTLVVDDDSEFTDLIKIILEPNAFQVFVANSGKKGVALAKEVRPDIVILDLYMPGMDGWQVCKQIRKFSNVPIIILSAINKPGMVAQALDAGADDFLLKPMPSEILIAHLRKSIRRARVERESGERKVDYCL